MSHQENKYKDTTDYLQDQTIAYGNPDPAYFEMMPAILDFLTYIEESKDEVTGETIYTRKRLDPYEKELYRVLKKAAGQGVCFKNQEKLAWEVNASTGKITSCKKNLSQSFEQLAGNPLIIVDEKRIATVVEGKIINTKPKHFITIQDNWKFNNAFMASYHHFETFRERYHREYKLGVLTKEEAEFALEKMRGDFDVHNFKAYSPHECGYGTPSSNDGVPQRAPSPRERKQTTIETNPFVLETNPNGSMCPNGPTAVQNCLLQKNLSVEFDSEANAVKFLTDFGFTSKALKKIDIPNSLLALQATAEYLRNQIKKGKKIDNPCGYFLEAFQKDWWRCTNSQKTYNSYKKR